MFADDTAAYMSGKNLQEMNDTLNKNLSNLMNWTYRNRLSLNMEKTVSICFSLQKQGKTEVRIHGNSLPLENEDVEKVKYLGLFVDRNLSWKLQLSQLKHKITQANGVLYQLK